ncbi:GNAT family N-acetyltransferase [Brevibacillus sp. SYP-B805]|uniref:GNAT family N-acetyltransferase n=1 Tax=Brevibacillus sp. SYP-B805 TaxID=1578199 RepID=UPI0013ECD5A4|nr:GNAT family N-acetyltransferase [Brevibacillus sp. SYP-B805]NGQ95087.1 GNAT family N-acetyltransferase [Brevibacillus sp. SYP-B805]
MEMIKASVTDTKELLNLFAAAKHHLRRNGIDQWDFFYPNRFVIQRDIKKGELYGIKENDRFIAAVTLNEEVPKAYANINWESCSALVIHRLVVDPAAQGKGLGQKLLQFSEEFAKQHRYPAVHLDAYSGNMIALHLYEKNGYQRRGEISFPFRKLPYICFEKSL